MASVEELRRRIEQESLRLERATSQQAAQPQSAVESPAPEGEDEDEGLFGIVNPETRQSVRQAIDELSFLPQMAVEMAPATLGSVLGGAAGAPLGPAGVVGGAAIGGLAGEAIAQETGITPRSNVGLGLAGGAPIAGPAVGAGLRAGRGAVGAAVQTMPAARSAIGQTASRKASDRFQSLGGEVLANQKGLMARSADDIFKAARESGVTVSAGHFRSTLKSLQEVVTELEPFSAYPEVASAIKMADQTIATLAKNNPLGFDDIIKIRTHLGEAVGKAQRAGGVKAHTAERLFASLVDDLDTVASSTMRGRRPARLVQAGFERAKLEFSIRDFEQGLSQFVREIPGAQSTQLNVSGFRNWLRTITDPKSKRFNKHLTSSLKDELPRIKEELARLDKLTQDMNPGGRGSLVVRGIMAASGGSIGAMVAGAPGAAMGALAGASGPEALTAILMSPRASDLLERAIRLGQGQIPVGRWTLITQAAVQAYRSAVSQEREPRNAAAAQ